MKAWLGCESYVMKNSGRRSLVFFGSYVLGFGVVFCPTAVRAQAGPGPIHPAPSSGGESGGAPRAAADEPKPPDRKDLWGTWKLDVAQSDDAMQQIKDAKSTGSVGSPRTGGGSGNGSPNGNNTGIHLGGPASPFPGGGNGRSPRNTGSSDDDFTHAQMQELTNPAGEITLSAKDTKEDKGSEVNLTDDLNRQRVFFTDGRKIAKSKDEKYQEYNSHWEDYRLVGDVEGAHDARATRSFEPAPGGQVLFETIRLERTKTHDMVEIRYVYEKVAPNSPLRSTSAPGLTQPTPDKPTPDKATQPPSTPPASSSSSSSSSPDNN
jgi:hypothetical protein